MKIGTHFSSEKNVLHLIFVPFSFCLKSEERAQPHPFACGYASVPASFVEMITKKIPLETLQ
jgi:hypothetical protein